MAIAWDVTHISSAYRQVDAQRFPTASGRVLQSKVYSRRTWTLVRFDLFSPEIEYGYEVGGTSYHGNRYRYGDMSFFDSSADRIVAAYPVGVAVTVFYDPRDPAESLLRPGLMGVDLFDALGLFVANVMALAVWRYLFQQQAAAEDSPPMAGGVRIVDGPDQFRACLTTFFAPAAALAASGAALGVAMPAVFLTVGSDPPLALMVVVWLLIGSAAAWGYVTQAKKLAAGAYDLVIDKATGTVRIPGTMGRKEEIVLPLASITGLDVDAIAKRAGKGIAYRYAPAILFTSSDGCRQKEPLVELPTAARARALAGWIGERLQALGWSGGG
jgi:hypothetical protein